MRTTQEILDAVIAAGYYDRPSHNSSDYMCIALEMAFRKGVISVTEFNSVTKEIREYMTKVTSGESATLSGTLNSLADAFVPAKVNLAVYKDWENRPYSKQAALNIIKEVKHAANSK